MSTDSRLFDEIERHLLKDEQPSQFLIDLSKRPEFSRYPLTMLKRLITTEQSPVHHPEGNVWNHTLLVVDEAAKLRHKSKDARVLMWSALLHDTGKPDTTKVRKGKITAYDHDRAGEKLAREFLTHFTDDTALVDTVCGLVRYHMQILYVAKGLPFADIKGMKQRTDIREVALIGLCDRLGRTHADREKEEQNIARFVAQCTTGLVTTLDEAQSEFLR